MCLFVVMWFSLSKVWLVLVFFSSLEDCHQTGPIGTSLICFELLSIGLDWSGVNLFWLVVI